MPTAEEAAALNLAWRAVNAPETVTSSEQPQARAYAQHYWNVERPAQEQRDAAVQQTIYANRQMINKQEGLSYGGTHTMAQLAALSGSAEQGRAAYAAEDEYYDRNPSAAFLAITSQYAASKNMMVDSKGAYAATGQLALNTTAGEGGFTGRAATYKSAWEREVYGIGAPDNEVEYYQRAALRAATERPGFTAPATLGDIQTRQARAGYSLFAQAMGLQGESVASDYQFTGQMLEYQRQAAYATPSRRDETFYMNELQKWAEAPVEQASAYHHIGMASGVPVPANPFEYQADLAVEFLKGKPQKSSEFFSPVSGEMSKSLPSGEGVQQFAWREAVAVYGIREGRGDTMPAQVSFMDAVTKLGQATGQYGPYGKLYGGPEYPGAEWTPAKAQAFPDNKITWSEAAAVMPAPFRSESSAPAAAQAPGLTLGGFFEHETRLVTRSWDVFIGGMTGQNEQGVLALGMISGIPEQKGLNVAQVGFREAVPLLERIPLSGSVSKTISTVSGFGQEVPGATSKSTAKMLGAIWKEALVSNPATNAVTRAFQVFGETPGAMSRSTAKALGAFIPEETLYAAATPALAVAAMAKPAFPSIGKNDPTGSVIMAGLNWVEGAKSDVIRGVSGIKLPEQKPATLQENTQTGLRTAFALVPGVGVGIDYTAATISGKPENVPYYSTVKSIAEFFAPASTARGDYEKSLATYQKDVTAFTNWQTGYESRMTDYEKTKSPATFTSDVVKYGQLKAEYAAMDTTYNSLVSRETALKQQATTLPQEKSTFDKFGAVWESVNKETAKYTTDVTGLGRYTEAIKVDESTVTGKAIAFGKGFYTNMSQYPVELAVTYGAGKALTIGEAGLKHGVASAAMSNKPLVGGAGRWLSGVGVEDTVKIGKAVFGGIIITDAIKNIIEQPTYEGKGGSAGRTVLQFAGFGAGAVKSGIATEDTPNRMSSALSRFTNWVNVEPENVHAGKSFVTGKPALGPLSSVWEAGTVGFGQIELAARGKLPESRALGQAYEIFTAVRGTQPYNAKAKVNLWDLQEVPWEHKVLLDKYLGEEPHSLFGSGVQQGQGVPADKLPSRQLGITPSSDVDMFTNPKKFMQKLGSTEGAVVRDWQGYEVTGRTGKWVAKIEGGYEQVPSRVSYGGAEFAVDIHGIPLEYPKLPGEVAGRPAQTGYKQEWQDLVSFKVLGDPFAVTPRSWQLTQIKDKTGKVVQVYEHADVQRYRLMDAFRKNLMTAESKNPDIARGGRFEKDTVRLLSAFEDAIQTERLGRGGFGKTTKLTDARAKDLIKTEQRLTALKDIEIRYRPGVSPEKAFLENTVSKAVESNTERQIPIWERAIRTEQSRLSLKNPKDAARYLQLVEAHKQITILKETPSAAKDIMSVKLGELQTIAGENLGYGMKMSGEPLETPVSLGNLKKLSEYDAPVIESPLKWSIRTKQPDYGHVNRKLSEMPMPEKTSTKSSVDAWLKKTGQKVEPVSEKSFRSSRDMARDIYDEFEIAAPAKLDRVITFRSPEPGSRKLFTGIPVPSALGSPEPARTRSPATPTSPVGRYISPVKAVSTPGVSAASLIGYSTAPVARAYAMASLVSPVMSPILSTVSRASPVFSTASAPPPASFPYSTPSRTPSPATARSPFAPSPVKPPYMPAIGYDMPSPPGSPGPDKPYGPDFPPSPPPPDTPFLPGLPFGNLFGGGSGSSGGYRRGRSWINVHPVGAERVVESRWSMPKFRMPKMKGFRF